MRRSLLIGIIAGALILGMGTASQAVVQFRAVWADVFHVGFYSKAEIDDLITRCVQGRYNAVVVEVLAYHDSLAAAGSHGAFWNSSIVPKSQGINPAGLPNGDPLLYLVQQAHANGIEVHPWLVAYRACTTWPPANNPTLQAHPEWLSSTKANIGLGPSKIGSVYELDPGSSDVQEYLMSIVRELVTNYEIDGINWDYIRYTQTDAGYPSDNSYYNSGLKRCRRATKGLDDTWIPNATGDATWDNFRRREVSELVRRCLFEVRAITGNPRQPLRHTAALIPWGDAPADFHSSSAYRTCFQDWEWWMSVGYLDAGCPMLYYRECQYPTWYRNWVNAAIGWRYQRHMFIGPGIYMNMFPWSVTQMQYALDAGADGLLTYSYASTRKTVETPCTDTGTTADWTWYQYVADNLFTSAATPPTMPWRYAATATEGTLYGRVINGATGLPVDSCRVRSSDGTEALTDGNGYYILTMLSAASGGTTYSVTASDPWSPPDPARYPSQTKSATITRAGMIRLDFALGYPVITNVAASGITSGAATITWNTDITADSQVDYGTTPAYGQQTTLDPSLVTSHSVALSGLLPSTLYYYRVRSSSSGLLSTDGPYTFTTASLYTHVSKTFPAGWSLMSVPIVPADADPLAVFAGINISGNLHRYEAGGYVAFWDFDPAPFGAVKRGDGFWLHLDEQDTVEYDGTPATGTVTLSLPNQGWYMIGQVHQANQLLTNCEVYDSVSGLTKPFAEAAGAGWVQVPLYYFDGSGYLSCGLDPWDQDDHLRAWTGYWLYTLQPSLELRIPKP